jgi:hypothetical protein
MNYLPYATRRIRQRSVVAHTGESELAVNFAQRPFLFLVGRTYARSMDADADAAERLDEADLVQIAQIDATDIAVLRNDESLYPVVRIEPSCGPSILD